MTPEYLDELADMVDPDKLWRVYPRGRDSLTPDQRKQVDAGVALRRYAQHKRDLQWAMQKGQSLIITPLEPHSSAVRTIETPPDHERLRPAPKATPT